MEAHTRPGHFCWCSLVTLFTSAAAFSSVICFSSTTLHFTSTFTSTSCLALSAFTLQHCTSNWAILLLEDTAFLLGEGCILSLCCCYHFCQIFRHWQQLSPVLHHMTPWLTSMWHISSWQLSTPQHVTLWPWGLSLREEILLIPIPTPISVPSTLSWPSIAALNSQAPSHHIITFDNQHFNHTNSIGHPFNHHCISGSHCWCHQI